MATFVCRYCGKGKDVSEQDCDAGRALAEEAAFIALGHTGTARSTPYQICKDCAKEIVIEPLNSADCSCTEPMQEGKRGMMDGA